MPKLRKILAVYGDCVGSDDALVRAIEIARSSGARLTVARPLGEAPLSSAEVEEARRRLTRIVPWIVQEGIESVSTEVLVGIPHQEVSRLALEKGHDLVIASQETDRGVKDVFRGRTASKLMRECPCPVWITKPRETFRNSLMAAVDVSIGGPADPVDERVLELAVAVAAARRARLHVVHCWDVGGKDGEMLRSELPDIVKQEMLDKHKARHRDALNELLAPYRSSDIEIEAHLPRCPRQDDLASIADRLEVDLVVMGAAYHGGISGLLKRNAVESVSGELRCGVLAVKPDAFRKPASIPSAMIGTAAARAIGH